MLFCEDCKNHNADICDECDRDEKFEAKEGKVATLVVSMGEWAEDGDLNLYAFEDRTEAEAYAQKHNEEREEEIKKAKKCNVCFVNGDEECYAKPSEDDREYGMRCANETEHPGYGGIFVTERVLLK